MRPDQPALLALVIVKVILSLLLLIIGSAIKAASGSVEAKTSVLMLRRVTLRIEDDSVATYKKVFLSVKCHKISR